MNQLENILGALSKENMWQDGIYYEQQKSLMSEEYHQLNSSVIKEFEDNKTSLIMDLDLNNTSSPTLALEPWWEILDKVMKTLIGGFTLLLMLSLGCTLDWKQVVHHLRKPIGSFIGMLCQFVILPAVGFTLAFIMGLEPYEALGLLLVACAPGGGLSNFFAYKMDGNLALSIVMTTLSSTMAMLTMPWNLWIYSRFWLDVEEGEALVIPYMSICISLAGITIPVAIGMLLRTVSKRYATLIIEVLSTITYIFLVGNTIIFTILYYPVLRNASLHVYISTFLFPLLGVAVSYCVAKILAQSHQQARTIAIETGCQNVPSVVAIILFSFTDKKVIASLMLFPALHAIMSYTLMLAGIAIFKQWKSQQDEDTESSMVNDDSIKQGYMPANTTNREMTDINLLAGGRIL